MQPASSTGNPFDLDDTSAYRTWRKRKLHGYPECADDRHLAVKP